jgi:oligopeptidase B
MRVIPNVTRHTSRGVHSRGAICGFFEENNMKQWMASMAASAALVATGAAWAQFDVAAKPPVAAKKPKDVTVHGDKRVDNYFWMRSAKPAQNKALMAHLRAENAYADAVTKPLAPLKAQLYTEMLARIQETDESVPYQRRNYWYTSKTEQGKQYATHVRRKGSAKGPDEVLLDVNELAKGKK